MDRNKYLYSTARLWLCVVVMVIKIGGITTTSAYCKHFTRDIELEENGGKGFFVFEVKFDSIYNCSAACLQNDLCVIFTYDEGNMDCMGFHSFAITTDLSNSVREFSGQVFHIGHNNVYTRYGSVSLLLLDKNGTFEEARQLCLQHGGRLPIMDTEEKFNDTTTIAGTFKTNSYAIGLSDAETEGTFVWDNGEQLTAFMNTELAFNNKDVVNDKDADCISFRNNSPKMRDVYCQREETIVCEKVP